MELCTALIPGYAWQGEKFLNTDTSNMGIGDVMLQIWKGQDHVIAYESKTISRPERNCCIGDYCKYTWTIPKLPLWQEFHLCITTLSWSDSSFLKTWKERQPAGSNVSKNIILHQNIPKGRSIPTQMPPQKTLPRDIQSLPQCLTRVREPNGMIYHCCCCCYDHDTLRRKQLNDNIVSNSIGSGG